MTSRIVRKSSPGKSRPVRTIVHRPLRILVCDLGPSPMAGVRQYARDKHWLVVEGGWPPPDSPARVAKHYDVSGIISAPNRTALADPGLLARDRVPIVVADMFMSAAGLTLPQAVVDHRAAGQLVAEHFLERQFRHLAYCCLGRHPAFEAQMQGFRDTADAAGAQFHCLEFLKRLHEFGWDAASFRRWLASELAPLPKPMGLMVDSDHTALEAVEACLERRLLVPERVSIVGCWNNLDVCLNAPIPLSSVDFASERAGYQAAAMLDRLIHRRSVGKRVVVIPPAGVVVRQSSDIAAVPHLDVARAVHFIMHHFTDPRLQVNDVVAATSLSRPGLNLAFQKHVRCSVVDYIRRLRLRRALDLLRTTDASLGEIADRCGYRDLQHFRVSLRRSEGLSPRAWRRRHRAVPPPSAST